MVKARGARPLFNYFYALLSENPDYPYWDACIYLASQVGESSKMIELTKSSLAGKELSAARKREIRNHLSRAYLAADQVDEAVKIIRALLAEPVDAGEDDDPAAALVAQQMQQRSSLDSSPGSLAITLAKLGHLLGNDEWLEEGLARARKDLAEPAKPDDYARRHLLRSVVDLLLKRHRGPEAEALALNALAEEKRLAAQSDGMRHPGYEPGNELLASLALIYHRAGRHADVVRLFDGAPNWRMPDIKTLIRPQGSRYGHDKGHVPAPYLLARALKETGNEAAARRIAREYLYASAGYDPFYQLLIEIDGPKLLPFLDELYARDQFEERPLIWKAHLLRVAGQLDEAETLVKAAIGVDPSDGEQGKGDRMRVYGVYADIHRDRGNAEQEKFFRDVLKAIRLAESADDYYAAGLYDRGIRMYEQSLTHFADAYCIQSRMALQLSELGRHEEAEKHYLKAFELMPDSFGRVESHCFGCEGAFDSERAQGIAERVFERLARERPDKAQIHYLLGYLRQSQGRYLDALASFRRATELDADYLNAWKKIGELDRLVELPAADAEAVALDLLRLDPLMRHGRPQFGRVQDLAKLWNAVRATRQHRHEQPESVYPLKASAAELKKKQDADRQDRLAFMPHRSSRDVDMGTPGGAIAAHDLVQAIIQFIESTRAMAMF